jgi:chloramphenicol O-acetyltransferase
MSIFSPTSEKCDTQLNSKIFRQYLKKTNSNNFTRLMLWHVTKKANKIISKVQRLNINMALNI